MPAAPVRASVRASVRVLVVDDDARVRTAIRDTIALEPDLLLVGSAAGAGDARAVADGCACAPFVALVDVLLPDEASGLALIADLARRPQCVVVAMSGRGAVRRSARAAGAASFVEKGDDIEVLLAALRTAAGSTG